MASTHWYSYWTFYISLPSDPFVDYCTYNTIPSLSSFGWDVGEINSHVRPRLSSIGHVALTHKTLARPALRAIRRMSLFRQLDSQSEVATTPGDLLLKLNDTCPVSVFNSLVLGRYLCPALDALPADQRANLMAILQEAERATVDVSSHFGRLDLSGEGSDDDDEPSEDDDDDLADPSIAAHIQLTERKRRIEVLIAAHITKNGSSSELDEEVLSWLPILWHLGVEVATNTGEVLAALRLCDTIRYVVSTGRGPF